MAAVGGRLQQNVLYQFPTDGLVCNFSPSLTTPARCAFRILPSDKHPQVELLGERGEAHFDNLVCISTLFPLLGEHVYNLVLSSPPMCLLPYPCWGENFKFAGGGTIGEHVLFSAAVYM